MEDSNGRISYSIGINTDDMQRDAQRAQKVLRGIGTQAVNEGNRIDDSFRKIGAAIGTYFAVDKLKDFTLQIAKVRGEFQQLEMAFTTMLGSGDKANDLMQQLIKTAATTPFGMTDVANGAKQLLAYGVAADEVNDTLVRLGDIAAGLSIPLNDLAYLYGTTMVQGRLYTQDLNQFLGRGIPLTDELAKQFGVAKSQVKGLVEEGKVGFPEVKKAIEDMTNEGGKFGGLMAAQSKTITGQMSNIEDSIEQMMNEIGRSQEGLISDTLGGVSKVIDNWRTIGKVILTVVAAYGAYKAAVIAVWAAQKLSTIWGAVTAFISLASEVRTAKDAMLLFNMATKANPLGLILGLLASAAAAFELFGKDTSEAAQMSEKFGEKAATSIRRVNTLATTLEGLESGTATYKKAMEELNGILESYGATQIQEGDNIDTINRKREQAIELIKNEGIERQRLNALESGNDTYNQRLKDAQDTLQQRLKTSVTNATGDTILNNLFSKNTEVRENAEAISAIIGEIVEKNINLIAGKTGKEYEKGLDEIYKQIQDRMVRIGISKDTVSKTWFTNGLLKEDNIVQDYINSVQDAAEAQDNYTKKINASADAEAEAAQQATNFTDRVNATQRSLDNAADGVHGLYRNIRKLMEEYANNDINFHINFDGQIPKWMTTFNIPKLKQLAERFTAIGMNMKKGQKVNVNGRIMTREQILQRGYDYSRAADQRQTQEDDKARKREQAQADAKKHKSDVQSAAKKAADEAKRRAEEQARYRQQLAEEQASEAEQAKRQAVAAQQAVAQARLDAMRDGAAKQLEQLRKQYDDERQASDDKEAEFRKDNYENAKRRYEMNPANKKTAFSDSHKVSDKDFNLTKNQQAEVDAMRSSALSKYQQQTDDLYQQQVQNLYDYVKEYGTAEGQILAIQKEYAAKIAKEQDADSRRRLQSERDKAIDEVKSGRLLQGIDLTTVFSDFGVIMAEPLRDTVEQLKAYTHSEGFSRRAFDEQKTVFEAIEKAEKQLGDFGGVNISDVGTQLAQYNAALTQQRDALQTLTEAETAYIKADEQLREARRGTDKEAIATAEQAYNTAAAQYDAAQQTYQAATTQVVRAQTATTNSLSRFKNGLDRINQSVQALTSGSLAQLWSAFGSKLQGRIGSWIAGTSDFSDKIADMIKKLGQAGETSESFGKKIGDFAVNLLNNFNGKEGDLKDKLGKGLADLFTETFGDKNKFGDVKNTIADLISGVITDGKKNGKSTKEIAGSIGQLTGDILSNISKVGEASGNMWGMIIGLVLQLLDTIKQAKLGDLVKTLLSDIGQAISGLLAEIGSGKLIEKVVSGLGHVVGGIITGVANLFSGGSLQGNKTKMEDEIARLSAANEQLAKSIDSLKESIQDENSSNLKSLEAYRNAVAAQKDWNENQQNAIRDRASEYSNSGHGFLGLKGRHSFNYEAGNVDSSVWKAFNDVLSRYGYSSRVNNAGDIWSLTPEEMKVLRDFAPKAWAEFFKAGSGGESNPQDLVNEYIEKSGALDTLTDALNEKLTGYSWSGFKDSYKQLLQDLKSDTDDFADNIEEVISNAVIEAFMNGDEVQKRIKHIYQMIADAASDDSDGGTDITQSEADAIRQANKDFADYALAWRKSMEDVGLIVSKSDEETRTAASKGIQSVSQESVDRLEGRATAIQSHTFSINENTKLLVSNTSAILRSVMNIEGETRGLGERMTRMEAGQNEIKGYVSQIALKGVTMK